MYNEVKQNHIDYKKENDLNEINEFDVGNDFEKIIFKKNKQLKNIFNFLNDSEGVIFTRLTGSGSCLYSAFDNKDTAFKAKKNFQNKYPKLWSFIAENNFSI
jgi:4-diphosphocytidyl-2C-methyl-D-erythritol kinase